MRSGHDELLQHLVREVADLIGGAPPWRPGALDLLRAAARQGVPTALVTTSFRRHAEAVAGAAPDGSLAVVVGAEDVARHKPDPQAYLLALTRLSAPAEGAVAFEDSVPGLRSALAAGVVAVAIQPATVLPDDVASHPALRRADGLTAAGAIVGIGRPQ